MYCLLTNYLEARSAKRNINGNNDVGKKGL